MTTIYFYCNIQRCQLVTRTLHTPSARSRGLVSEGEVMKQFIITLALVVGMSTTAIAQPLLIAEAKARVNDEGISMIYDIYAISHFEDSNFGVQAFGAIAPGWGELYLGPTYAPVDWLELSIMAGAQSFGEVLEPRYGASLWAGTGGFDTLWWVEYDHLGPSSVWYDAFVRYQTTNWLRVGLRTTRFTGVGPTTWIDIPHTPLSAWMGWSPVGIEEGIDLSRATVAIQFTF